MPLTKSSAYKYEFGLIHIITSSNNPKGMYIYIYIYIYIDMIIKRDTDSVI